MDTSIITYPNNYQNILNATNSIDFEQVSDPLLGSLLTSLSTTKLNGTFLELGTGSGLSTSWILKGMCNNSSLVTIDNDKKLVDIAQKYLGDDERVEFKLGDGEKLIKTTPEKFYRSYLR